MLNRSLILAMGVLFLLNNTNATAQRMAYPPVFDNAREEIYKAIDDVKLKLWVFEPDGHQKSDRSPAIVFFFGGGWKAGSPAQFESHCRYLASQGIVAITADYRVRDRHGTLADCAVRDAKSAIRWVRTHADRLGVDPNRVVAAGGSAGGHLATCTAVIGSLDEPTESTEISSVPNALALFNPAVLLALFEGQDYLPKEKLADIATRTGVSPAEISPIHHVREKLPPTIIFHGEADTTVPFSTVRRYTELAQQAGNRCDLVGFPGEGHGFFNTGRNGNPGECYLMTLEQLHQFLVSLGYLSKPPSLSIPESRNVHLRSHLDHSYHAIVADKQATVAFIGGSITEMNGYRVMVCDRLQERFPETQFEFINAGISSTCSTTGAFRLDRDVLAHEPDLLFVEFAVNDDQDAAHPARECLRGMEGILRHARTKHPDLDIVVTHFVNPPMLEKLTRDETPISSGTHEQVARHYGVATVDLARELSQRIAAGSFSWKEYGGTHPAKPGNRLAADLIEQLLTAAWKLADPEAPQPNQRLPKALDANSYAKAELVDVHKATIDAGWKIETPDWSNLAGATRERFRQQRLLVSQDIGAQCQLRFNGRGVGLFVLAGPDAGTVSYSIDGNEFRSLDLYHRFSKGLHYPRSVMLDADLEVGPHELVIRVGDPAQQHSERTAIRILHFLVNR